jgi:hypothetical protein
MKFTAILGLVSTASLALSEVVDKRDAGEGGLVTRAATTVCGSGYTLEKAIPLPKGTDPKMRLGTLSLIRITQRGA